MKTETDKIVDEVYRRHYETIGGKKMVVQEELKQKLNDYFHSVGKEMKEGETKEGQFLNSPADTRLKTQGSPADTISKHIGKGVKFPKILKKMMIYYPNGVLDCYFAIQKLLEEE